ncbi:hypothetical protein [Janibacter limosus]|uniref:hypothetical protein n=1 Tax=Janibacter limosus TaxID=53458 RepID=UPI000AF74302|nr:hypothetical protein [Janibacter limosus]
MNSKSEPEIWVAENEPVATFFLHLPEVIAWPEGSSVRDLVKIGPRLHRNLESDAREVAHPHDDEGVRDLINAYVLASSILLHQIPVDLAVASGLDATMAAVKMGVPTTLKDINDRPADDSTRDMVPSGYVTIAEVAIPLQVRAAIMAADRLEEGFVLPGPEDARALIEPALDAAVAVVAKFQADYHSVTRQPLTILTRELLPSLVPYVLRAFSEIPGGEATEVCLFLVNGTISRISEVPELAPEKVEAVHVASGQNQAVRAYLDLHRQGAVALQRGNYREAAVMFSTASEALLNIVLCHMRWEEGLTPEESAADWPDGLVTRVKTQFSKRLGGDWNVSGRGAVGAWARDVAAVRHRVVHAGYLPSRSEAERSMVALEELLTFLGDRLVYGRNLREYPRTASELLTEGGLRRRDRYPNWLEKMQMDPTEPLWHKCFGEWYSVHLRLLADKDRPRISDESRSELLCVYLSAEDYRWILRDPVTLQAAEVHAVIPSPADDPVATFRKLRELPGGDDPNYPISIGCERVEGVEVSRFGPWVEQYHLCPMFGVMWDGSDFDVPWPLSAAGG